jgi:hypothetical protein
MGQGSQNSLISSHMDVHSARPSIHRATSGERGGAGTYRHMYGCMYGCMAVLIDVHMDRWTYVLMYRQTDVRMYGCMDGM